MNIANTENKTKKQVLNKELSINPAKEILAEIENKFEDYNSDLTNKKNDLKIILTRMDQLEKQTQELVSQSREERAKAEDLQIEIELGEQKVQNMFATMIEFWSREVSISDLVHRLGDNYLPPSERTEIIAELATENKKNANCEEENSQKIPNPLVPNSKPRAKISESGTGKTLF
jgi:hypothetical protein